MINVNAFVDAFEHESDWGYSRDEYTNIVRAISTILPFSSEKFENSLVGITAMVDKGKIRVYPYDIKLAIQCGLENRDPTDDEWD